MLPDNELQGLVISVGGKKVSGNPAAGLSPDLSNLPPEAAALLAAMQPVVTMTVAPELPEEAAALLAAIQGQAAFEAIQGTFSPASTAALMEEPSYEYPPEETFTRQEDFVQYDSEYIETEPAEEEEPFGLAMKMQASAAALLANINTVSGAKISSTSPGLRIEIQNEINSMPPITAEQLNVPQNTRNTINNFSQNSPQKQSSSFNFEDLLSQEINSIHKLNPIAGPAPTLNAPAPPAPPPKHIQPAPPPVQNYHPSIYDNPEPPPYTPHSSVYDNPEPPPYAPPPSVYNNPETPPVSKAPPPPVQQINLGQTTNHQINIGELLGGTNPSTIQSGNEMVRARPEEIQKAYDKQQALEQIKKAKSLIEKLTIYECGVALGIVAGVSTKQEVIEIMKEFSTVKCPSDDSDLMFYYNDASVTVYYNDDMTVRELQFGSDYKGKTSKGLAIGEHVDKAVEIYGQPRMKSPRGAIWNKFGVFCQSNIVNSIRIQS